VQQTLIQRADQYGGLVGCLALDSHIVHSLAERKEELAAVFLGPFESMSQASDLVL
jgi:hypothetical protein